MSRLTDVAAVLNVVSNVLTKNAALRKVARENKWKTSSVLRQVGNERETVSSYDTFHTEEEDAAGFDQATNTASQTRDSAAIHKNDCQPTPKAPAPADSRPSVAHQPSLNLHDFPVAKSDAEVYRVADSGSELDAERDQDIFFLRQARRIPNIAAKQVGNVDPRKGRKFRMDKDPLRPTMADRFDVRSSSAAVELRREQQKWKPQAAVETTLSKEEKEEEANAQPERQAENVPRSTLSSASASAVGPDGEPTSESTPASAPIEASLKETESLASELASEVRKDSQLSSSAVPSSRFSRLYHYTTLGASLGYNAFADSTKRLFTGPTEGAGQGFLSSKNTDLLVKKLSRMRGAALKLGQMISFQDENLPGPIREVLQRVQDSADYMPTYQLERVMSAEFGSEWRNLFAEFNDIPIAAASIGQVHRAKLPDGRSVAVKVQYPGVANSISSDLRNLSLLLTASRLLPKGLYLDKTIENARTELGWECDYIREAANTKQFRKLVGNDQTFKIPEVIDECSGKQVLTTEFLDGVGIAKSQTYSQETRDFLGTEIMRLCLRELAEFRFMQTDPNWTNFLYNQKSNQIELLDFGACRAFEEKFISKYCQLLVAAARGDRAELKRLSEELGYLTGAESQTMVNAHISSILTLSEPFSFAQTSEIYHFENQTITERVKSFIPVMLRERLSPPPEETYSLHRRLSGHFLLCARMRSRIPCKSIFIDVMTKAGYMKVGDI